MKKVSMLLIILTLTASSVAAESFSTQVNITTNNSTVVIAGEGASTTLACSSIQTTSLTINLNRACPQATNNMTWIFAGGGLGDSNLTSIINYSVSTGMSECRNVVGQLVNTTGEFQTAFKGSMNYYKLYTDCYGELSILKVQKASVDDYKSKYDSALADNNLKAKQIIDLEKNVTLTISAYKDVKGKADSLNTYLFMGIVIGAALVLAYQHYQGGKGTSRTSVEREQEPTPKM